jgi:ribosome biogenesis protein Tsr3
MTIPEKEQKRCVGVHYTHSIQCDKKKKTTKKNNEQNKNNKTNTTRKNNTNKTKKGTRTRTTLIDHSQH